MNSTRKIINNLAGGTGLVMSVTNVSEVVNLILCILSIIILLYNFVSSVKEANKDGVVTEEEAAKIKKERDELKSEVEELKKLIEK